MRTKDPSAKTATPRKRRSAAEIHERIVAAATEAFRTQSYAEATTASIARRAEVTEAQLFRSFGSKANLFRETTFKALEQHFQDFMNRYMPDGRRPDAFGEMGGSYTTDLQRFIRENMGMITAVVAAQLAERGAAPAGEVKSLTPYFERGASILSMWTGDAPKVAPELMVRVSFAAVLASVLFKDWLFPPGLASDEAIGAAINDFVMEGLSANWPDGPPDASRG